jgi:hypothetical protein
MTRVEALERVAEAAAEYRRRRREDWPETQITVARSRLYDALDALPAAPAQGEAVEVEVWRVGDHYELTAPGLSRGSHCKRLGTMLLPIRATVAGGGE